MTEQLTGSCRRCAMTERLMLSVFAVWLAMSGAVGCSDDGESVDTAQAPPSSMPEAARSGFPPGEAPDPDAPQIGRAEAEEYALDAWEQFEPTDVRVIDADELPYASVATRFGSDDSPGRDQRVHPSREIWLVIGEGEFHVSGPDGVEVAPAPRAFALVDSYTGLVFERGTMTK
jgi:hypothetical protein